MSEGKHGNASYKGPVASIEFRHLALFAYLLFLIPIVIFFWGWLKWHWAIIATAGMVFGFIWLYRTDYLSKRDPLKVPVKHMIAILALVGFWVAYSGNCHIGAEMFDISWRNIFLTDLVTKPWPVAYDAGYNLAYYFVFWMIPALVGKVAGVGAAFFTMWLYEVAILSTAIALFSYLLHAVRPAVFWMVTVVFLLFSGLNTVGTVIVNVFDRSLYGLSFLGVEAYCDYFFTGQSTNFYYRGNYDVLTECYNQMLFWLAVPLMLENRKIHSFAYLGLLLVPFSPWGCIGIIPLMLCIGIVEVIRYARGNTGAITKGKHKQAGSAEKPGAGRTALWTLKEIFSPANVLAVIIMGVVFGALLTTGTRLEGVSQTEASTIWGVEQHGSYGLLYFDLFNLGTWAAYFIFCLCEFGVFALFLLRKNRKNPLFWVTVLWLMVCPFIWVGTISGRDFCMNGSLPALSVIMFFIMEKLESDIMGKPLGLKQLAFVVVLTLAFVSPLLQMSGQLQMIYHERALYVPSNHAGMVTFEGQDPGNLSNFVCTNPEDTFFFTVLAR